MLMIKDQCNIDIKACFSRRGDMSIVAFLVVNKY